MMNTVKQFLFPISNDLGQVKDAVERQGKTFDLAKTLKTSPADIVQYLAKMTHPVQHVFDVLTSSIQEDIPTENFTAILELADPKTLQDLIIRLIRNILPTVEKSWSSVTDNTMAHVLANLELMVTRLCDISDDRSTLNQDAILAWAVENSQYEVVLQLERLSLDENEMTKGSHEVDALLAAFYRYEKATSDEDIKLALNLINWFSPNAKNTNKFSKKPKCDTSHRDEHNKSSIDLLKESQNFTEDLKKIISGWLQ